MSLLKLAAEQAEKEKSKKRKWAENGAMIGAGVGTLGGVTSGLAHYPTLGTGSKAGFAAKAGAIGGIPTAIQGGLMGLAGGAVQDHRNKKKKKAEQE